MLDAIANELDAVDRRALERAMKLIRTVDPGAASRYREMLAEGVPWLDVAVRAAARCQWKTLSLMLHQREPCHAGSDPHAGALLDELLDNGLSQYEPDPRRALQRKRRR